MRFAIAAALVLVAGSAAARRRDAGAGQHLPDRAVAAVLRRRGKGLLRQARHQAGVRIHRKLQRPARGPRQRQVRGGAFGGRQRHRHDRGGQGRRGDRLGRRRRHQRVHRRQGHQFVRRHPRQGAGHRRAEHRLCAAGQEDPAPARAEGRRRLPHQRGRRRPLPAQGDARRRRQRRRDHEPAVLGADHRGRAEEPRPHRRSARPLSGRRRLRAALLGQGQRPDAGEAISPAISSRCAGWSTRTTATRRSRS